MKTPDEIKKYLANCDDKSECSACYSEWRCKNEADALAYIQQLEADLEKVKRERDALMHDLREARHCASCKHLEEKKELNKHYDVPSQCFACISERSQHLWRGPCAENGGAEDALQA